jgi:hypothetical protein
VASVDAIADRSHFNSADILEREKAGINVTFPKPITSNARAEGRFGKQNFGHMVEGDVYVCPVAERLSYHYTNEENGLVLRRCCARCAIKHQAPPTRSGASHDGKTGVRSGSATCWATISPAS